VFQFVHRRCTSNDWSTPRFSCQSEESKSEEKFFIALLHKENLGSGRLSEGLDIVMKEITRVVSFTKARLLNNKNLFSQISLCSGFEYKYLLHILGLDGDLSNHLLPLRFSNCNIVCLCVCVFCVRACARVCVEIRKVNI